MRIIDHRLQQAWQSQAGATLEIDPDPLLKAARIERRALCLGDLFVILTLLCVMVLMLRAAFRDIHKDWPWLGCVIPPVLFFAMNCRRFARFAKPF